MLVVLHEERLVFHLWIILDSNVAVEQILLNISEVRYEAVKMKIKIGVVFKQRVPSTRAKWRLLVKVL